MTMLDATTAPLGADARAFVLLKSRRRLDLLNPDPQAWTDDDLAAGLSRTMRWGGASQWAHPLSVAQHSLTVLAIREAEGPLTAQEGLRELLHDATEFMLGWDCIAPLKAQLGEPFRELEARLQAAVDARYRLPSWTAEDYAKHKRADRLAAASEAFHVVGWSRTDMVEALGIEIHPLLDDPLPPNGFRAGSRGRPERRNISSWSGSASSLVRPGPACRHPERPASDPMHAVAPLATMKGSPR